MAYSTAPNLTVPLKSFCIMYSKLTLIIFLFFGSILLTSCKKDDISITNLDAKSSPVRQLQNPNVYVRHSKGISLEKIKEMKIQLKQIPELKRNITNRTTSQSANQLPDAELEPLLIPIVTPLIESGNQIYSEIINQVIAAAEWQELSEEEKTMILNFDDGQKAELAMLFTDIPTTLQASSMKMGPLGETIRYCVSAAIGVTAMKELITQTGQLMTVKTAIQGLKIIGKRYLSYVGIAWMIWDFTDCVASAQDLW